MSLFMEDPFEQLEDNNNVNNYKNAGKIATYVLNEIMKQLKSGVILNDLCNLGDMLILKELDKNYADIKNKGIAFPTLISVNNIVGHNTNNNIKINKDDLVKIELGVHINGFPAIIGYTTLISNEKIEKTDKRYNILKATILASREILQIMKPGNKNTDVIKILNKYADKYNCSILQSPVNNENYIIPGVMSYQVSRNIIDGSNTDSDPYVHQFILHKNNNIYDFIPREYEFEKNDVFVMDIAMSSGSGKVDMDMNNISIYKRNSKKFVDLKLKTSREALSNINNYFPNKINLTNRIKLGLKECFNKNMIHAYPCVFEKDGEYVSRIKFTVIVRDDPILITGRPADELLSKLE